MDYKKIAIDSMRGMLLLGAMKLHINRADVINHEIIAQILSANDKIAADYTITFYYSQKHNQYRAATSQIFILSPRDFESCVSEIIGTNGCMYDFISWNPFEDSLLALINHEGVTF